MPVRNTNTESPVAKRTRPRRSVVLEDESQPSAVNSLVAFLSLVVGNLTLSAMLFTLTFEITFNELASVSRHVDAWGEVGALIAWKAFELGLAWMFDFDARDVASFFVITQLPTFSLLSSFYGIRPTTILVSFANSVISPVLPFVVMRLYVFRNDPSHVSPRKESNRSIIKDRPTAMYTTIIASAIFSLTLYFSYATWLPTHLVLHFEGIPDLTAVHAGPEALPALFLALLLPGWMARDFLFVSSAGASADVDSKPPAGRQGEYLIVTAYRRTWGALSAKTKVLVTRTLLLSGMVALNTIIQMVGTVKGVDVQGAAGWGGVWAFATLVIGLVFGWIEAVEGV